MRLVWGHTNVSNKFYSADEKKEAARKENEQRNEMAYRYLENAQRLQEIDRQLAANQKAIDTLNQEKAQITAEQITISERLAEIETLLTQRRTLETERAANAETIQKLEQDINAQKIIVAQNKANVETARTTVNDLKTDIQLADTALDQKITQVEEIKSDLADLKIEESKAQEKVIETKIDLEQAKAVEAEKEIAKDEAQQETQNVESNLITINIGEKEFPVSRGSDGKLYAVDENTSGEKKWIEIDGRKQSAAIYQQYYRDGGKFQEDLDVARYKEEMAIKDYLECKNDSNSCGIKHAQATSEFRDIGKKINEKILQLEKGLEERDSLQKTVSELKEKLSAAETDLAEKEKILFNSETRLQEIENEKTLLLQKQEQIEKELAKIPSEQELRNEHKELTQKFLENEKQLQEIDKELQPLLEKNKTLTAERDATLAEMKAYEESYNKGNEQISTLEANQAQIDFLLDQKREYYGGVRAMARNGQINDENIIAYTSKFKSQDTVKSIFDSSPAASPLATPNILSGNTANLGLNTASTVTPNLIVQNKADVTAPQSSTIIDPNSPHLARLLDKGEVTMDQNGNMVTKTSGWIGVGLSAGEREATSSTRSADLPGKNIGTTVIPTAAFNGSADPTQSTSPKTETAPNAEADSNNTNLASNTQQRQLTAGAAAP